MSVIESGTEIKTVVNDAPVPILGYATVSEIKPVAGTASAGTDVYVARGDHQHTHGAQTDPANHAVATESANGFISSADKTKLDGVASGAAAVGSTTPVSVSATSSSAGSAVAASRTDHSHFHGNLAAVDGSNVALHGNATTSLPGFLSAADKTKLDGAVSLIQKTLATLPSAGSAPLQIYDVTDDPYFPLAFDDGTAKYRKFSDAPRALLSVKRYGAKGDTKVARGDAAITSGLFTLTSATATFSSGDVGKTCVVTGAGVAGAKLVTTVAAYINATTVTLSAAASTTVTAVWAWCGTDDTQKIRDALADAASIPFSGIQFWPGTYLVTSTIVFPSNVRIEGTSRQECLLFSTASASFIFSSGGVGAKHDTGFYDLTLFTTDDANSASAGIFLQDSGNSRITMDSCEAFNFVNYALRSNTLIDQLVVSRNVIHHIYQNASSSAVNPSSVTNSVVRDNIIYDIGNNNQATQHGIYSSNTAVNFLITGNVVFDCNCSAIKSAQTSGGAFQQGVIISNNVINNCAQGGIVVSNTIGVVVANNSIYKSPQSILIAGSVSDASFVGNTLAFGGVGTLSAAAIYDANGANYRLKIIGNSFVGDDTVKTLVDGIFLGNSQDLFIAHNSFYKLKSGVHITDSGLFGDVTIEHNRFSVDIGSGTSAHVFLDGGAALKNMRAKIRFNRFEGSRYGVELLKCQDVESSHNSFFDTGLVRTAYYHVANCQDVRIEHDEFDQGNALYDALTTTNVFFRRPRVIGDTLSPETTVTTGTMDVLRKQLLAIPNGSTIANFTNGNLGDVLTIYSTGASTVSQNSAIHLKGSVDFVMAAGDTLQLAMFSAGIWEETGRKTAA